MNHEFYLAGYDKDHDIYETIMESDDLDELKAHGKKLAAAPDETRCKETNEPFDWYEIMRTDNDVRIAVISALP